MRRIAVLFAMRVALALAPGALFLASFAILADVDAQDAGVADQQPAIKAAILEHMRLGSGHYVLHCRRAHGGCEARARRMAALFVRAGRDHQVDPWLLTALALRESGGNPDAVGDRGELGLMQLHPASRAGRLARRLCEERPRHCPAILVDGAARVLRASIDRCGGDVGRGLVRYHSGECGDPDAYARSVLSRRDRLRGAS